MATAQRLDSSHGARVTSEILDRMPPQNLEAERAVLGSLLLDARLCDELALILKPDDFCADSHAKLYEHILTLYDKCRRVDLLLLVEQLKQAEELELVGGHAYLAELMQSVPYAYNAVYYARIVRNKAMLRALIDACTANLRDAHDESIEPEKLLDLAEQRVFAVRDARSNDQITSAHDLMLQAFQRIDARLQGAEGHGIPTGFKDVDRLTGGLHESELVILAARPSMGKTALATNIAEYVTIECKLPTLLVSLEMAKAEVANRLLCSQGKIDAHKFRAGYLSQDDRDKLAEASARISQAPLFVDDTPARSVTEIAACARRLRNRENLRLLIIDYLQLIQPDNPKDPRQEQVAKITRRLKHLARELQIPVLCLAQLNRQVEAGKEGHRPRLSHLRESGAIEQDADVVLFIHREEMYHTREEAREKGIAGQADLIIAKQRNGQANVDVKLTFLEKFMRFEDAAREQYGEFQAYDDPMAEPF